MNISTECPVASAPYAGPIFDAMTQFDERAPMSSGVEKARAEGVQKMAIFARSRKALEENALETLVLQERAPDLLVVGAPKYFLHKGDLGADYTRSTVHALKKHRHPFIGEILFTHADKREGTQNASGERYVDPTAPGVNAFLDAIKPFRVPLMTHFEVYAWERDWPRMSAMFARDRGQIFIIPHMAFGSIAQAREILDTHPNVYLTISKKELTLKDIPPEDDGPMAGLTDDAKAAKLGDGILDQCLRLKPEWKDFLIAYQDRLLYATDAHKDFRWPYYREIIQTFRRYAADLPEEAQRKIAYRNAERLYGVAVDAPSALPAAR